MVYYKRVEPLYIFGFNQSEGVEVDLSLWDLGNFSPFIFLEEVDLL